MNLQIYFSRVEKLSGQPRDVAVSNLNVVFLVCGSSICIYREQQDVLVTHPVTFEPTSVAVSPQGSQIAVGGKVMSNKQQTQLVLFNFLFQDNKIHIFSVDDTALTVFCELELRDIVNHVAYSPNGRFFACADNMKNVTCYQLPNFDPISRDMWRYHAASITGLAFSPDGKKLASVAIDTHLMIYQTENITKVTQVKGKAQRF